MRKKGEERGKNRETFSIYHQEKIQGERTSRQRTAVREKEGRVAWTLRDARCVEKQGHTSGGVNIGLKKKKRAKKVVGGEDYSNELGPTKRRGWVGGDLEYLARKSTIANTGQKNEKRKKKSQDRGAGGKMEVVLLKGALIQRERKVPA